MNKQKSIAWGVGATLTAGVALVLAIRALIPSAESESVARRAEAVEDGAAQTAEDAPSAQSPEVTAHERPASEQPDAPAPAAPPEASAAPVAQPEPPRAIEPASVDAPSAPSLIALDGGYPSAAPGPVVPVEVLRADLDRVRARYEAAASAGGDGGARGTPESRRAMIALIEGSGLLRRLSAGDPAFHDQLNAYRSALGSGGPLDDNARAALRARIFDGAHSERAALYDEILQSLR